MREGRTRGWWGFQGMMGCAEETRWFDLPHLLVGYRRGDRDIEVILWDVSCGGPKIELYE